MRSLSAVCVWTRANKNTKKSYASIPFRKTFSCVLFLLPSIPLFFVLAFELHALRHLSISMTTSKLETLNGPSTDDNCFLCLSSKQFLYVLCVRFGCCCCFLKKNDEKEQTRTEQKTENETHTHTQNGRVVLLDYFVSGILWIEVFFFKVSPMNEANRGLEQLNQTIEMNRNKNE